MIDNVKITGLYKDTDDNVIAENSELVTTDMMDLTNKENITQIDGFFFDKAVYDGKKIVSILSGGNMDVITMSSVVQQGLILRDRIFTVSVLLPDKPGELYRVSGVIAQENGNVIKLEHNQFVSTNRNAAVELRITMEAFGTDHKADIIAALDK